MSSLGPNADLIGQPRSRWTLTTPALVLDRPAFLANISAMARLAATHGCALRPHVKGSKNTAIGRLLSGLGSGIACATLFEAETMVGGGVDDILITGPIVTRRSLERLVRLSTRAKVTAVVDCLAAVEVLRSYLVGAELRLNLLVDIDVGQSRTGVTSEQDCVQLAKAIEQVPSLAFAGVQAYYGHLQGIRDFAERKAEAQIRIDRIATYSDRLRREGLPPRVISGGGTGTAIIDMQSGVFTELQPGSFPFMDAAYEQEDIAGDGSTPFAVSLFVYSTVVSANQPDRATIDAGMKAI